MSVIGEIPVSIMDCIGVGALCKYLAGASFCFHSDGGGDGNGCLNAVVQVGNWQFIAEVFALAGGVETVDFDGGVFVGGALDFFAGGHIVGGQLVLKVCRVGRGSHAVTLFVTASCSIGPVANVVKSIFKLLSDHQGAVGQVSFA